jgi:hypothetical protein
MTTAVSIKTDLRSLFGPIRDQGQRPTCLAFAASDLHAGLRGKWVPLSCEYAFFHAQRRSGLPPTTGSYLSHMLLAIREDGQPDEESWPYLSASSVNTVKWQPPSGTYALFRRAGEIGRHTVDDVIAHLDQGIPILLLFYMSLSFYKPAGNGVVDERPGDGPNKARGHAVIAVAHGTAGAQRVVLVRNSWGVRWGADGHGWLTERFIKPRAYQLAKLKEDLSVSPNSATA